jgi:hypothetical protein
MTQILTRSREQQELVARLADQFDIDPEKVLFLNKEKPLEPWLNYKALVTIARASGEFKQVAEDFSEYIPAPLNQIVHSATVVNNQDQIFTRSGVATIGEQLPNEDVPDEHALAAARAMRSALDDAGFDPTKAGSQVPELHLEADAHAVALENANRMKDLARIHIIAAEKKLIVPVEGDEERNNTTQYRAFLLEKFPESKGTAVGMKAVERAQLINALMAYEAPKAEGVTA